MEDVQDGIKISIQDGVEEDPEEEEKVVLTGKTFVGLISIQKEWTTPTIETVTNTEIAPPRAIGAIATVVTTAVT